MAIDYDVSKIKSFLLGPDSNDKRASTEITQRLHREFKYVFSGIGYFNGTFSLQVKSDSKPYQALPRCIANALQWLAIQGRFRVPAAKRHHHTIRHR